VHITLLIDSIVRQTTVLVAQLATSGGVRAPLSKIADQVFLDLTGELEAQGVSRKVSADMFGMALRAYRKKIQRLSESSTHRGRSLWESVLEYLEQKQLCTRQELLLRFRNDGEGQIRAVLHDLVESGLVLSSGNQSSAIYRCSTPEEQRALQRAGAGLGELLWVLLYRGGPSSLEELTQSSGRSAADLSPALDRLLHEGRVQQLADHRYQANSFAVPLGAQSGWEAAMFDHYQAVVSTLCQRLQTLPEPSSLEDTVGGSTYTFKVWAEHPHYREVLDCLKNARQALTNLRAKVEAYNLQQGSPTETLAVTVYTGQGVVEQSSDE